MSFRLLPFKPIRDTSVTACWLKAVQFSSGLWFVCLPCLVRCVSLLTGHWSWSLRPRTLPLHSWAKLIKTGHELD